MQALGNWGECSVGWLYPSERYGCSWLEHSKQWPHNSPTKVDFKPDESCSKWILVMEIMREELYVPSREIGLKPRTFQRLVAY